MDYWNEYEGDIKKIIGITVRKLGLAHQDRCDMQSDSYFWFLEALDKYDPQVSNLTHRQYVTSYIEQRFRNYWQILDRRKLTFAEGKQMIPMCGAEIVSMGDHNYKIKYDEFTHDQDELKLKRAINSFKPKYAKMLTLLYLGYNQYEIADELNVSQPRINVMINNIKKPSKRNEQLTQNLLECLKN